MACTPSTWQPLQLPLLIECWSLPFVVLAVEQPVEDLTQGADMMQVVQDDDEWHVPSTIFTGTLVSKVGQVLAQLLKAQEEHRVTVQPQRGSTWSLHGIQIHGGWEAHGGRGGECWEACLCWWDSVWALDKGLLPVAQIQECASAEIGSCGLPLL